MSGPPARGPLAAVLAARAGHWELDFEIEMWLQGRAQREREALWAAVHESPPVPWWGPAYTTSLDAAMRLVPAGVLAVSMATMNNGRTAAFAWLSAPSSPFGSDLGVVGSAEFGPAAGREEAAALLPLALCAAALRARARLAARGGCGAAGARRAD